MIVETATNELARQFLDHYHPLRTGGCLKGQRAILVGLENGMTVFLAVFVYPRQKWTTRNVTLELSRLAWSPMAKCSASTFLRKCSRILRREYSGEIVTYALPGSSGIVYERAGYKPDGVSSGCARSRRGPNGRPTPDTVGTNKKLKRFFYDLEVAE